MKKSQYLIIFLLLLLPMACGDQPTKEKEYIRPVFYQKVVEKKAGLIKTFSGVAKSAVEAKLSFKTSGTIQKFKVKTGDKIKKGSLIASIDDTEHRLKHKQAVLAANKAKAEYNRLELLYKKQNISLRAFESFKTKHKAAGEHLKTAKLQVQTAVNELRRAKLFAPFNGVVSNTMAKVNQTVGAGVPVVILAKNENPEVKVAVPKNIIRKIKKVRLINISFSALPESKFAGKVVKATFKSAKNGTYPVILKIIKPSADILPGMAASINFYFKGDKPNVEDSTIIVQESAVGRDGKDAFVFIISQEASGDYMVNKRVVKPGKLKKNGFEIKEGIKSGELIVTAGLSKMYNGRKVTLLEE